MLLTIWKWLTHDTLVKIILYSVGWVVIFRQLKDEKQWRKWLVVGVFSAMLLIFYGATH